MHSTLIGNRLARCECICVGHRAKPMMISRRAVIFAHTSMMDEIGGYCLGVSIYLQHSAKLWRRIPEWVDLSKVPFLWVRVTRTLSSFKAQVFARLAFSKLEWRLSRCADLVVLGH